MKPTNILVVLFEGAPTSFAYDHAEAREYLADVLEEDGDRYQVYSVRNDGSDPEDFTIRFADQWASALDFGDGDEPDEFLRPFTGFVLAHRRASLIQDYRAAQAMGATVSKGALNG